MSSIVLGVGDGVADADRVRAVDDPVVDDALVAAEEGARAARAELVVDDVNEAAGRRAERLLVEHARQVLAVVDDDARVARRVLLLLVVGVAVGNLQRWISGRKSDMICLPVHSWRGLRMQGIGSSPEKESRCMTRFMTRSFSRKQSRLVKPREPSSVSCTMPITGLFDCGETMQRGTSMISEHSARVSMRLQHVQVHLVAVEVGVVRRGARRGSSGRSSRA